MSSSEKPKPKQMADPKLKHSDLAKLLDMSSSKDDNNLDIKKYGEKASSPDMFEYNDEPDIDEDIDIVSDKPSATKTVLFF